MPGSFLLSAVVLSELSAGAADNTERKSYEVLFRAFHKERRLKSPASKPWKAKTTATWSFAATRAGRVNRRQRPTMESKSRDGELA